MPGLTYNISFWARSIRGRVDPSSSSDSGATTAAAAAAALLTAAPGCAGHTLRATCPHSTECDACLVGAGLAAGCSQPEIRAYCAMALAAPGAGAGVGARQYVQSSPSAAPAAPAVGMALDVLLRQGQQDTPDPGAKTAPALLAVALTDEWQQVRVELVTKTPPGFLFLRATGPGELFLDHVQISATRGGKEVDCVAV
eukprot:SAG22_NODE_578_length_8958_cov_5.402980_2_plen_198_part_00